MRVGALFAKTGLASMGLTLVAVVVLIFGVVVDDTAGFVAGGLVFVFYTLAWVVLPLAACCRGRSAWSVDVRHTDWLLTKSERANAQTRLDDRHPGETAWSEGNLVRPLIHGSDVLRRALRARSRRPSPATWSSSPTGRATPTSS